MKLYLDTSVFGGVFDDEFSKESQLLFDLITAKRFVAVISSLTEQELLLAPEPVKRIVHDLLPPFLLRVPVSKEAERLAEQYLTHGAVSRKFAADALHIAVATLSPADLVVSWNFKHIVNIFRIRRYNSVNILLGYRQLEIRSPREVVYE